jgi:glycosyltransferase involved in cell wall biosynthesis
MTRALFVNSGLLGHHAFAGLMRQITSHVPGLDAHHTDLSCDLTVKDRLLRRLFSVPLSPSSGPAANLDLRRWRQELNVGLLAARRIARAERAAPFDLLHFHTQATAYASLGRMQRTPSIVSIDCTQRLASLEAASRLGRASYRASIAHDGHVFRAATAIVATSRWAAADLAAEYPDCRTKLHVLPFPVDTDAFDAGWIEERAGRARADRRYRPRVLFVGGDFLRKGGAELLEAWREGRLDERADLDVVTDWPVPPRSIPAGVSIVRGVAAYSDRWRALWRSADLFVMPSRHEAFGIVYEEAAASGIPAIGSDINAVPEIIDENVTGFLIRPGDRAGLVRAVNTLVESVELRERMGRAARRRVAQRAAVPVYAAALGTIVNQMVNSDVRRRA